jgi:hypothetical protein
VRWNAIIDTSGTPPRLKGKSRNPDEIAAEITAIADENNCEVEIYFDRFSWSAYIVLWGRVAAEDEHQANADARKALEVLEAVNAKQWLDTAEKSAHPNVGIDYSTGS